MIWSYIEIFSFVSAGIAILASLVLIFGLLGKKNFASDKDSLNILETQISLCQMSAVLFCVFAWVIASSYYTESAEWVYRTQSEICLFQGCAAFGFAFAIIIFHLVFGFSRRNDDSLHVLRKIRNHYFLMGVVFVVFSVLLDVPY